MRYDIMLKIVSVRVFMCVRPREEATNLRYFVSPNDARRTPPDATTETLAVSGHDTTTLDKDTFGLRRLCDVVPFPACLSEPTLTAIL